MFYICTQKLNKPTTTNMLNVIAFNNNCPSEEMTNAGYNLGLVLIYNIQPVNSYTQFSGIGAFSFVQNKWQHIYQSG